MEQDSLFDHLARASDPWTSHEAARTVNRQLTETHVWVLGWLRHHGPSTDDGIATAMVDAGISKRHEQARRIVRTLREEHRLIVPYLDEHGEQPAQRNQSGRLALLWRVAVLGNHNSTTEVTNG